jgi:crossover junction endodeoxyribonuclease RusA
MADRRKPNLDNINNAVFDALIHSGVILDDEQIDVLHSESRKMVKSGKIELVINKLE